VSWPSAKQPRDGPPTVVQTGTPMAIQVKKKLKVAHTRLPSVGFLELIPVLGSHPAGDVSHKPGGRLTLLFTRPPAVTLATLNRAATNFAAWWTHGCEQFAQNCYPTASRLRFEPMQALLRLSPAR